jgi:outer membrane autotransporter protein
MQNKIQKIFRGGILSLTATVLLLLFTSTQAMGANITQTGAAATNATTNLSAGQITSGTDWVTLTANGVLTIEATTTFVLASSTGASSGYSLFNATVAGVVLIDAATSLQLDGGTSNTSGAMVFNLGSGTNGTNILLFHGDTYAAEHAIEVLGTDASDVAAITIGDGTGTTTFNGAIDLSNAALNTVTLTLNGATLAGAVSDGAAATLITVNVTGNSTISGTYETSNTSAAAANKAVVTITDGVTLSVANTFTQGASLINLGSGANGGTLALTGNGKTLTAILKGSATNKGILTVGGTGTTTITGEVGNTNDLASITLESSMGAGLAAFSGAVSAVTLNVNNTGINTIGGVLDGAIAFGADGHVSLADAAHTVDAVTTTAGNGTGTITYLDQGSNRTHGATVGAVGAALKKLNINVTTSDHTFTSLVVANDVEVTGNAADDAIIINGGLTGNLKIMVNALVTVAADEDISGNIATSVDGAGVVTFTTTANDTTIAGGSIGASTFKLAAVTAGANSGDTATIVGDVFSTLVTITNGHALGTVAIGGNVTSAIEFGADGLLNIAADKIIVGSVAATANDNTGTLTFAANTTGNHILVSTTTGASGRDLKLVTVNPIVSTTATLSGRVYANAVTHAGAGTLIYGAEMDGVTNITGSGYVTVAGAHTGAISTGTAGTGTVTMAATKGITGIVGGTGALLALTLNSQGGVSALGAAVTAETITLNGTGNTTAAGTLIASTGVVFGADGTLTMDPDTLVTGAVTTTAGDGTGTLTYGRTSTNSVINNGGIGASGAALLAVTAGSASGVTATITGDVNATTLTIIGNNATGIVAVSGNINATTVNFSTATGNILSLGTTSNVSGKITTANDNKGTLKVNGTTTVSGNIEGVTGGHTVLLVDIANAGKLTLGGDNYATTTTVGLASTLAYSHATASAGNEIISCTGVCTLDFGSATVAATAVTYNTTASTLKMTFGTVDGKLNASGTVLGHIGNTFVPTIKGAIVAGEYLTVIDAATGTTAVIPGTITESYDRYTFTLVDGSHASCAANDLCLVINTVAPAGVSSNSAAVSAIADVAFAGDDAMATALNGLSGATLDKALTTLAPSVDGGAIVGSISAGSAAGATISTQIASLRSGIAAGSGLNAGDGTNDKRFWTQGFGTSADQDVREKINGFKSTTGGVAFGVDKRVRSDTVVGVAYSFSHTDVDTKDSKNGTKVKGHQATFYGTHDFDRGIFGTDGVFIDGQLSYAYNDYSGSRYIEVGAVTRKADSEFDGNQISTKFDLGKTVNFSDKLRFTPTAGISYTHVAVGKFTETGAGDSSLSLKKQDYDILNLNVRAKLARTWEVNGADVTPEVHAGYSYEAIHDKIQTTSTFTGGGDAFISTGFKPANHTYSGGMGLTFGASDKMPVDITFTYDFSGKDDFESHSGLVKGAWKF